MAKLQMLEHQFIEHNVATEVKITVLSSKMDDLIKNVANLAWTTQLTEETVNLQKLNGRNIAKNLTIIQSDLTKVLAEQKLLVTNNQWKDYLSLRCCNSTMLPYNGGSLASIAHSSNYKSCNKIPFRVSGVYTIQPEKSFKKPITVFCDQEYESGGWAVIQHRYDGSTNFYRGWQEYKDGFGDLEGEFWLATSMENICVEKPKNMLQVWFGIR
uniref:Fibrinogen C-terminal domain-containing protein n=1 Tax=Anopheles maculatus TaxID=74869 RepID=A0A182STW5_9DIPT